MILISVCDYDTSVGTFGALGTVAAITFTALD